MSALQRLFFSLVCLLLAGSTAHATLSCKNLTGDLSVSAQGEGVKESNPVECQIQGEAAIHLGGDLNSTLSRAQGYVEASFFDSQGRRLWQVRKGPWLGQFSSLALDESIAIPAGATNVRLVAVTESKRKEGTGKWQIGHLKMEPGALLIADLSGGSVIAADQKVRWRFNTLPAKAEGDYAVELRDPAGKVVESKRFSKKGEGAQDLDLGSLGVGYYDVLVRLTGSQLPAAPWRTALVVLPGGEGPNEPRFGMDAALSWYGGTPEMVERSLSLMRQAGIGTVRDRLTWTKVQPERQRLEWGIFRTVADAVARHGMESVTAFHDAPRWARPGGGLQNDRQAPLDDEAVFSFGQAFARGMGPFVRSVEYWNEQNSDFFPGSPYQFASGFKAFSAGVKSVDPSIRVLIGAASGKPGRFFEETYKNDVAPFMDARNQHYYGRAADIDVFMTNAVAALERNGGVEHLPGWVTEMGYSLQRDSKGEWRDAEQEQAAYLVKTYANGFATGYERVFFFFWRELAEGGLRTWGILRDDFSPRPAYLALGLLSRHLAGAKVAAAESHGAGRTVYFRRPDGKYVAVSWGGGASPSRWGSGIALRDIYGKAVTADAIGASAPGPWLVGPINSLPATARPVAQAPAVIHGPVPLRLSVRLAVDGKDQSLPPVNQATVGVGEGSAVDISGRVFAKDAQGAPVVVCQPGPGAELVSAARLTLARVPAEGEPFVCRFKVNLTLVGESHVGVQVSDGVNTDRAWVTLSPDAGMSRSLAAKTVMPAGHCPRWISRNSPNLVLSIDPNGKGPGDCPAVAMTSRIGKRGESWAFPSAQIQGENLSGSVGVRLRVGDVPGYGPPPTPLMAQLVEKSGGIWLVELRPGSDRRVLSGLFNLARPAPWAKDDNGHLDLGNVSEIMVGWGGYGGEAGQQHGFVVESLEWLRRN